ncbi:MAG: ferrochelatase [Campylobacterales bacterium]|nr:ferrochelatase [Campylobacterales bacterium]
MKRAILLLNMGGPSNRDEIKIFLTNMFNDKNILSMPSLIRKFVAFMIVKKRLPIATENYNHIGGKSPINDLTKRLVSKLQAKTSDTVDFVMNYTPPFPIDVLKKLQDEKVDEITLFSMYPQYSTTTTKSSLESIEEALKELNYTPKIKIIDRYFDNDLYNKAIIENIKKSLKDKNPADFALIFSAHGLPVKVIEKGDPYQKEIEANVEILKNMLKNELDFSSIHLAYQSKVGPMKWLEPSLEQKLKQLSEKNVIIYPIAFTIDNSETVFELDIELREFAEELGIHEYLVASCLNDSDLFSEMILEMI